MSRSELRDDAIYRALFEVNNAVKLLIDPGPGADTGRILDVNQAAVDFYGWSREQLLAMRITEINTLSPDEVRAEMEHARSLRRRYFRFRHRTARGDLRSVEVHSGPVRFGGRDLLFSIVHDVTERDLLEEQLRKAARLETIGALAGGVAHDFNNLLTVVISAAQLVRARLTPDHPAARFVTEIDEAARRGADLTRQLLAFSRRQVMAPRPVAVGDVVAPLVPLLRRSIGTSHDVEVDAPPGLPPVLADPAQLEQVVMNLVLNARDAMPGGGRIRIELGTSAGDERALVPVGAWVTLAVVDEGVGMDEATRARVFEPFFTTKPEGTGMGLATVYGVVVQTGGHLAVDSAPGRGSRFTVFLPATAGVAAPPPSASAPPVRATRAATILVVDDLDAVRATVAAVLADLGHTVLVAGSYREALEVADARLAELDLVLTDVVMPGRSGVDLVHALRARRPDLPCIVMSGDLRDHVVADLAGVVGRLAKPFTLEALQDAVGEALAAAGR